MITEYERGLLDMLDALTVTERDGSIKALFDTNADMRTLDIKPIMEALNARDKLENQTKLDEARKLLETAGYVVRDPSHVPDTEEAANFLRLSGYNVMKIPEPDFTASKCKHCGTYHHAFTNCPTDETIPLGGVPLNLR